jgi:hypothetical protein
LGVVISVAHAQIAFGKSHAGQFSEITIPQILFAGADEAIE